MRCVLAPLVLLATAGLAEAQHIPMKDGPPAPHWRRPELAHRTWGWQLN